MSSEQYFRDIEKESKLNNIYKLYRNDEEMCQQGPRLSTATEKSIKCWVGTNNFVFCSGYNAPTLFKNLRKMSLVWHSPNTLPKVVLGQVFRIIT